MSLPGKYTQSGEYWRYRIVVRLNSKRTALAVLLCLPFAGASERNVVANTVLSRHNPVVEIRVPKSAEYVGTERFMLHDPKLGDFDDCGLGVQPGRYLGGPVSTAVPDIQANHFHCFSASGSFVIRLAVARKPAPKPDDPEQAKWFI